ncbi:MAG: pilus assembly protein [Variovorax sp.]|jgi:type IV pilus assembly protein PilX|nr:MAG: pilus assembly protein [Variovorax sp.]
MTRPSDPSQRGVSLIVVLLILVVVSVLGVGGAQIATMAERGSRNDRDMQVAWQSAEAALTDAEFDIHGPNTAAGNRRSVFKDMRDINLFVAGCGTSGTSKGLCTLVETGKPAWLTVDFTIDAATARTTALGTFTGRGFAAVGAGGAALGVQPAKAPRYIIEPIVDVLERDLGTGTGKPPSFVYRVTAMGFGPRADIQAMTQMMYRD